MISFIDWLTIVNFMIVLGGSVASILVLRGTWAQTEKTIQDRVRQALADENELLQSRVERLEKDNSQLHRLIDLIIMTLKKTNKIDIEIDKDMVIVRDQSGNQHAARVDGTP